ncbi:MAG: type I DNA topoisomerase [Planctomycetota bacterium]
MAAAKKKKSLVIVESPAKAKTINKYLGPNFEVVASKGHVRDLPKSRFGIDVEKNWEPTYRVLKDRKELIADLKKRAAAADMVYLAPDPDREGEAIAWHLKESLGLKDEKTQRVTFNEITKTAIKNAFDHAGSINMDRVAAQEARRFLDRVVGYRLSPLLSLRLAQHLSAGRVQSVAVRLIVEREREIGAFVPEEYWRVQALVRPSALAPGLAEVGKVKTKKGTKAKPKVVEPEAEDDLDADDKPEAEEPQIPENSFWAELSEWDGKKFEANSEDIIKPIVAGLESAQYKVSKIEQKDRQEKPQAPFTTSTLQQQASLRLRYTAKRTMMIAQRLYEGVDLGPDGSVALITYMRTDSTRISDEALANCRKYIETNYGDKYLPEKPNLYAASKDAQGAHEAVRPTDLSYTPEMVAKYLPQEQQRLYALIYNRFVACQMKPAIFAVTNVEIQADKGVLKAQGKTLKFDGYRKVATAAGKQEDTLLPPLKDQEPMEKLELKPTQHFTEPPPRFNEASLVKTLEKEGIGRPSTYATIITKIQERGYVELKERRFYASAIGMTVTDTLVEHFPTVMDLQFTRHMEAELDLIEEKKVERNVVLNEFYEPFTVAFKVAETKMMADAEKCPRCGKSLGERFSKRGKFFGCTGYPECTFIKRPGVVGDEPRPAPKLTDIVCPTCGKPMVEREGASGPFLGCSGYPDCKTTMNFDAEGKPVVASQVTEHMCEKCGKPMIRREGKNGPFLGCSGYPKCRNLVEIDAKGEPVKPFDTGLRCEKCGSPMGIKKSFRGPFLGCNAYPKCRSTMKLTDELKEKFKDHMPAMPPKKPEIKVEGIEPCPQCGAPMKVRTGRGGNYFLGCTKYPKCRGVVEPSPDMLEKIADAVLKVNAVAPATT